MKENNMKDGQSEGKSLRDLYPVYLRGEKQAYEEHCRIILDVLAPVGGYELHFAQSVADGRWRLQRALSIEAVLSDGRLDADKSLRLLKLYKRNIQRGCNSDLAELKRVQAKRKKALQEAIEEAMNRPTSCIN